MADEIPSDIWAEAKRLTGLSRYRTVGERYEHTAAIAAALFRERLALTEGQISHMVDRFLAWRLPDDFSPDDGISFEAEFNQNTPWPARHEPTGTNLFNAEQATAMVRHMLEELPS